MTKALQEECRRVLYCGINEYFCADLTKLIIAYDNRVKTDWRNADFIRGYYNYKIEKCTDFNEALCGASYTEHIELIELLITQYGADDFNHALCCASHDGHIMAIKLLKQYGANDFNRALYWASDAGHIEAMELLKSYGANNFNDALYCARSNGQTSAVKLLEFWRNQN